MPELTEAMRETLNRWAKELHGGGRSDYRSLVVDLAKKYGLGQDEARRCFKQWDVEDHGKALAQVRLEIGDRVWYWYSWDARQMPRWTEAIVVGAHLDVDGSSIVHVTIQDAMMPESEKDVVKWGADWQVQPWSEEWPEKPTHERWFFMGAQDT